MLWPGIGLSLPPDRAGVPSAVGTVSALPPLPTPNILVQGPGADPESRTGPRSGGPHSTLADGSIVETAEREARKALNRLRRALEKSRRELDALVGAIRHAEGDDFPAESYDAVRDRMEEIISFLEEEGRRLEEKILETGGLEPGRIRRG